MTLLVETVGPAVSVQDAGRPGALGMGLSRGGAADRAGYIAACALMDLPVGPAALEMAGFGGVFRFEKPTRFALTGARMRATLDGQPLEWQATHLAPAGSVLSVGAAEQGVYGYFLPAGGIDTPVELGGRGFHQIAGLGQPLTAGESLFLLEDPRPEAAPVRLPPAASSAKPFRVMPGPQTDLFEPDMRATFEATTFQRSARANRQGVRLEHEGAPFSAGPQLTHVSDFISEGDVQMTGDGTPYVLMVDCQTMGGYPRIGTVLPADLPRLAQTALGETVRFCFVTLSEAEDAWQSDTAVWQSFHRKREPRVRDPREMRDLLTYELIGKPLDG